MEHTNQHIVIVIDHAERGCVQQRRQCLADAHHLIEVLPIGGPVVDNDRVAVDRYERVSIDSAQKVQHLLRSTFRNVAFV